ncbi:MAG: hemerythrin protein [Noviherbaspirillum sp.]|nr:hemerythrin protein [Noviherbaspirillum sp.]
MDKEGNIVDFLLTAKRNKAAAHRFSTRPLVEDICKELTIHATIEEELFYLAARAAINDNELINEAEIEHAVLKYLIQQLMPVNKSDERFLAKVTVLREYTKHHMNDEETEVFPKAKRSNLDLSALGRQLADRKKALRDQLKTPEQVIGFEPVKYFVGKA